MAGKIERNKGNTKVEQHQHAPMDARVLGGPAGPEVPATAWDRDPLLTLSEERRLLQVALPASIVAGLLVGLALLRFGLTAALVGMLVTQTGGCFGAYVIAQRRRTDPLRSRPSDRASRDSD